MSDILGSLRRIERRIGIFGHPALCKLAKDTIDEVVRLRARVAELEGAGWVRVWERLPAMDETVIFRSRERGVMPGVLYSTNRTVDGRDGEELCWLNPSTAYVRDVTHWRPLPPAPADDGPAAIDAGPDDVE